MSGPHGGEHGAEGEGIHLPAPSFAPAIIGLGIMFVGYGVLFGLPLLVIGTVIFLFGLVKWLVDDARDFMKAGEHGGHG